MSRSYFTEDSKMIYTPYPKWSSDACMLMKELLWDKGYHVNIVARVGCDRKYHDAWQVFRGDIPRLIEQLFRQRIVVEVQAEGQGMASINFVYDYGENHILECIGKFQKNKVIV